jgi:phosphoglycolate phosphatase
MGTASGPSAIVFDLDGTLISSPLDLRAVAVEMERLVRQRGVALPPKADRWSAPELYDFLREAAPALAEEALAIPAAHERRAIEAARLEPYAAEALVLLKARGFRTAVWTNNSQEICLRALDRFALRPLFDLIVTRDDVRALKPNPDGLRLVKERWADLDRIYVIGDSWVDGLAAHAGGVPFVAYRADLADLARRGIPVWAAISDCREVLALLA